MERYGNALARWHQKAAECCSDFLNKLRITIRCGTVDQHQLVKGHVR